MYDPHTDKIIVSHDVKFDEFQDKKNTLTSDNITLPLGNDLFQNDSFQGNENLPLKDQLERDSDNEMIIK